jgi:hypothetical protein
MPHEELIQINFRFHPPGRQIVTIDSAFYGDLEPLIYGQVSLALPNQ